MQEDVIHIDSRSHLEVADNKHRYSKNLRLYFKEYDRLTNCKYILTANDKNINLSSTENKWSRYDPFFDWLDQNENPPNLKECPRSVLDEDRVLYIDNEEERINYDIYIDIDGLWRKTLSNELITTGSKGWIFVLSNGRMLGCEKRTTSQDSSLRFHHSSFLAGAPVHTAGMIVCNQGKLIKLFPHSGHYRPHDRHLFYLLAFLKNKNVNLHEVQVDVQRIIKASRNVEKDGSKAKKFDSALYCDAITIYYFLKLKQKFHDSGLLNQINKLRNKTTSSPRSIGSAGGGGGTNSNSSDPITVVDSSMLATLNSSSVSSMLSISCTDFTACHIQSPTPLSNHKKQPYDLSLTDTTINNNTNSYKEDNLIDLKTDLFTYIDEHHERVCISPPKSPELISSINNNNNNNRYNSNNNNNNSHNSINNNDDSHSVQAGDPYIRSSLHNHINQHSPPPLVLQLPIVRSDENRIAAATDNNDDYYNNQYHHHHTNRTRSGSHCSSGYATPTRWENDLKSLLSESPMIVPFTVSSPVTLTTTTVIPVTKPVTTILLPLTATATSNASTPRNSITTTEQPRYHHNNHYSPPVITSTNGHELVEVVNDSSSSSSQNNHVHYSSVPTHLYTKDIPILQTTTTTTTTTAATIPVVAAAATTSIISTPKPIRLMNSQSWEELVIRERSGSYSSTTAVGASSPNAFSPTDAHISAFELKHDVFNNNNINSNASSKIKGNLAKDHLSNVSSNMVSDSNSYIKEKIYFKNQSQLKENKSSHVHPSSSVDHRSNTSTIVSSMSTQHVYRDSSSSTQQRIQPYSSSGVGDDDVDIEESFQLIDKLLVIVPTRPIDALSLNSSKIGFVIGSPAPSFSSSLSSADSLTTAFEENSLHCNDNMNSHSCIHNILLDNDEDYINSLQVIDDELMYNNSSITKTIKSTSLSKINNNQSNNYVDENNLMQLHTNPYSDIDVNDDGQDLIFGDLEYNENQNTTTNTTKDKNKY